MYRIILHAQEEYFKKQHSQSGDTANAHTLPVYVEYAPKLAITNKHSWHIHVCFPSMLIDFNVCNIISRGLLRNDVTHISKASGTRSIVLCYSLNPVFIPLLFQVLSTVCRKLHLETGRYSD